MNVKSCAVVLMASIAFAQAQAGNVCKWSGGAGDGKWSSPKNWETVPVSGNGDELVFDTTSAAIVTENDVADFDVSKITVTGVKGNELTINGKNTLLKSGQDGTSSTDLFVIWDCGAAPVVINASVTIEKEFCLFDHTGGSSSKVTVNGDFCYAGSGALCLRSNTGSGKVGFSFNGAVSAPSGLIHVFPASGGWLPNVDFNGPVTAKEFGLNNYTGNWGGNVTLKNETAHPSAIQTLLSGYGFLHLQSKNVFAEDGVINVYHCPYGDSNGTTLYANQKVKRLVSSNRKKVSGQKKSESYVRGSGYPTLTVCDDEDEDISFYFDDALNLTWAPVGAKTLSIVNAMTGFYSNTISGTITVNTGRIKACEGTTFKFLSKLVVLNDARFEVAGNNAHPFGDQTVALLDANARIDLKSDCTFAAVSAAGQLVTAGTYTAAQLPSVIAEGSTGSLTVLSSTFTEPDHTCWIGQDGEFSVAENWLLGQLPTATVPGVIGCIPGALSAKISTATTVAGALTVDGFAGCEPAELTTSADVSFVEKGLTLGANGLLKVTAGTAMTKDLTTASGSEIVVSGTGALTSVRASGSMSAVGVLDATIRLSDNASYMSATSQTVKASGSSSVTYLRDLFGASAGKTLVLEADGHASYCSHALTFGLGLRPSGATYGGLSRFSFAGQSQATVGSYAYVGYAANGRGELCLADQATFSTDANVEQYGLFFGSAATDPTQPAMGVLRMSGGHLDVMTNQRGQAPTGLGIGWGMDSDCGDVNCNVGEVWLSGGAITNTGTTAWTAIGVGAGKGAVYQTGGEFAALPNEKSYTNNTVLGFRGGCGRYEISGGRYYGTANVIVGGMAKEDGPLPAKYTYLTTDRKGTGLLKVTGGTFETTKDVLVSHGGDGMVEIGAGGVLKAANLRLESATAKLAFAIGAGDTCGKIVLSGTLEAAAGAAIEVDVSNLIGYEKVTLLETGDLSGFDPQRVVVCGDTAGDVKVRKIGNRLVVGRSRGLMLIFR